MNNKGFTISELLVTFVLVMAIVLGLFKLVDHYRERQQNASAIKEITSYKNEVIKTIEDDILFNCGGLKKITPLDVDDKLVTIPSSATQAIQIEFNTCGSKILATIKDDFNSNSDSDTIESGIKYGDRFFKYPSKFISAVEDIIWEESHDRGIEKEVNSVILYNKRVKFYSIKIGLSHSELNRIFNINISTVVNLDTDT